MEAFGRELFDLFGLFIPNVPSFSGGCMCFLLPSVCKLPLIKTCYDLTFLFFTQCILLASRYHNPSPLSEGACNLMYVCILILCLNLLSYPKIRLDFPMKRSFSSYVYMERFIDPAFPAPTEIYLYLFSKTFYFSFFIFACLVKFTSLIQSHTEQ